MIEKIVDDISMYPMYVKWQTIDMMIWYYDDNIPQKWDVVAFHFSWHSHIDIRVVQATSIDRIEFREQKIMINNQELLNSLWQSYIFSSNQQKYIESYLRNKKLPYDLYLLVWDNIYHPEITVAYYKDLYAKWFIETKK